MEQILSQFVGINIDLTQELLIVALIMGRTMPVVLLTPFLGGEMAPPELRMGLGVILTVVLWPLARESVVGIVPYGAFVFLVMMLKEIFIGFCIGFLNAHIFWVMDIAGRLIDTVRGTSMSEVLDPHSKKRVTPFGTLYTQLLVVFFVTFGGHHIFLTTFFYSFESLPLNKLLPGPLDLTGFFEFMFTTCAQILVIATLLAAPAIAATLITDVVFGIMNRVAPQLNAYFMAMPVKAVAGVIMVLVGMDAFVSRTEFYMAWGLKSVDKAISLMSGTP